MNTANKLTILRIILVPVFVLFMSLNFNHHQIVAGIVFVIASITDALDGYIARKHNLITTFGKFVDPLADKILVSSALIMLVHNGVAPGWVVVFIMARELLITGFRTLAVSKGHTIAASPLGKIKTITQLVAIIALLFAVNNTVMTIGTIVLYLSLFFTVLSGADYLYKNREVLDLDNL